MNAKETIINYMQGQYDPVTAKTIANDTRIPIATVRARLSEFEKTALVESIDTGAPARAYLWAAPQRVQRKGETLQELESLKPAPEADAITPEAQPVTHEPKDTAEIIAAECDAIKAMLLAKNAAYGNSAIEPVRVFSKSDTIEQINVRLDDKLSRLMRGEAAGEDTELDLIGYLILKRVATTWLGGTK